MFVRPKVYIVGCTRLDAEGLSAYLHDSGNEPFLDDVKAALDSGLSEGEALTSFYAKLCYNSLSEGKNLNLSSVRDIAGNLRGCHDSGHGSVFEHASINFVVANCSRVYEIEQMRHRVGTAYSVLSGRYFRSDALDVVFDELLYTHGIVTEAEIAEVCTTLERYMAKSNERIGALSASQDLKKKLTSAVRRLLPQGRATNVGFTANFRSLRHMVQMRTAPGAEAEIREIFAQVYALCKERFPLIFYGAQEAVVDGSVHVHGMKTQPYQRA